MASGANSKLTKIVDNSINETSSKTRDNEKREKIKYLKETLPSTSPIYIPKSATIEEKHKKGYEQVKYRWKRDEYIYEARWHTRTPNAPESQGESWVVMKRKPGIGYGPNSRNKIVKVLIGKKKWISYKKWEQAIKARKYNTITKEMEDILKHGHWKPKRK